MRRRSLLQWLAAALSALPGYRRHAWAEAEAVLSPQSEATLRALGTCVLPTSLGSASVAEITARFEARLRAYRANVELDHGYGHTKLRTTGPSPVAEYDRQLAALERAARAEGTSFVQLAPDRQRALLALALDAARITDLPERPDGRHVAADLLAFFFQGSEANDLCYGVAIGRDHCRGLPGSEDAPSPLTADD